MRSGVVGVESSLARENHLKFKLLHAGALALSVLLP